ncbi:MAG TPA: DUF4180 domain-containing protein [Bryobacteraceae bacterium]|nr:DUF4180 domain-containing protein [Bryobacteraceae bacterium]
MTEVLHELHGIRVLECVSPIRNGRDAADLLPHAWAQSASWIAIPAAQLEGDFFRLRTGVAGEVLQKFVTYQMRVAIVGDISEYVAESTALRDFVYEANRGEQVWFVPTMAALEERLRTL